MAKPIQKKDLKLPDDIPAGKFAVGLYNVFTPEECDELIRIAEEKGFEIAQVNIGGGREVLKPDVRNSNRCIWDSPEQADRIWQRIREFIPETWNGCKVIGLNERLRILRYDPVQYFAPHLDGLFVRENGETSYITVHIYLNEGYKGGSTTFIDRKNVDDREKGPKKGDVEFKHKTGSILLFEHRLLHEGSRLFEGRKYTIRTDVMYEARPEQTDVQTVVTAAAGAGTTSPDESTSPNATENRDSKSKCTIS